MNLFYKFIFFLLITIKLYTMEQHSAEKQASAEKLVELLDIKLTDLFDEALAIAENFDEEEIESASIDSELKKCALVLKQRIYKQLFRSNIAKEIEALLDFGANVNAQDENGNTPLLKAQRKLRNSKVIVGKES